MAARRWLGQSVIGAVVVVLAAVLALWLLAAPHLRSSAPPARVDAAACPRAVALGPACGACIAASCCAEMTACYASADCIDLNDCATSCGGEEALAEVGAEGCPAACEARHPGAVPAFRAWDGCAHARCAADCPRGPGEDEEGREGGERRR